jgi:hypothetical protein
MANPGTVFQLIPEGGNHFWVVISKEQDGMVLAVNTTDARKCPDSPCILEVREHPTIIKRTAIIYRKAREFESLKIDREIASGTYVRRLEDCSHVLLQRIINGAKVANDLTFRLRGYLFH